MDSIKVQDVIRHIFNDEDKGCEYIKNINVTDGVEVLTKVLPELIRKAEEKENANDIGYFNKLSEVYRKIIVGRIMNMEHLWVVYCKSTGYPYMLDGDMVVLYDYASHAKVEEKLKKAGYDISFGIEGGMTMLSEIAHMYRNGYKNIRFTDGRDNMITVSREDIAPYSDFFNDEYVSNPGLEKALIAFFQEFRKPGASADKAAATASKEAEVKKALRNADYMVPCIKEETDEAVSISHPYADLSDKVKHAEGEQVLALPVFTDGFEMDKCYEGKKENMVYTYIELLKTVKEIGAAGIIVNPLGVSYYVPIDVMKQIVG